MMTGDAADAATDDEQDALDDALDDEQDAFDDALDDDGEASLDGRGNISDHCPLYLSCSC